MKTYSDLQAIEPNLLFHLELEPVGTPEISILIGKKIHVNAKIFKTVIIHDQLDLLNPFQIQIELKNKIYDMHNETAIKICRMTVDGIDLVPKFDYLAQYDNDHDNNNPTSYLGFNGKWTLTFDRPFYQWLHQATGQGWLLG